MPDYPVLIPPIQVGGKLFSDRVSLTEAAAQPLIALGVIGQAISQDSKTDSMSDLDEGETSPPPQTTKKKTTKAKDTPA
jgi:hypothetical protein